MFCWDVVRLDVAFLVLAVVEAVLLKEPAWAHVGFFVSLGVFVGVLVCKIDGPSLAGEHAYYESGNNRHRSS